MSRRWSEHGLDRIGGGPLSLLGPGFKQSVQAHVFGASLYHMSESQCGASLIAFDINHRLCFLGFPSPIFLTRIREC